MGRAPILDFKSHTHPAFLPDGASELHTCQTSKLMAYDWQCYCGVTHRKKQGMIKLMPLMNLMVHAALSEAGSLYNRIFIV